MKTTEKLKEMALLVNFLDYVKSKGSNEKFYLVEKFVLDYMRDR